MIRDRQSLGNGGLDIEYNSIVKMSKTFFNRNKLDFGDTSSIDDTLVISKNNRSLSNL